MKALCVAAIAILAIAPALGSAADLTTDSLPVIRKNVSEGKAVLVDVREKSEWDSGHIAGAIFLPLSRLQRDANLPAAVNLPNNKILYTHCVVGKRSVTAGHILERLGYTVRPMKPGYRELIQAGFPKAKN